MTFINGDATDLDGEILRLNSLLANEEIDLCLAGIGENGHLAFNDPPANFDIGTPYIVVKLDAHCRLQQCNEGWFESIQDVPERAISMSVKQILKSKKIILSIPGIRKAAAVRNTVVKDISPEFPSTILKEHSDCEMFLDTLAASRL